MKWNNEYAGLPAVCYATAHPTPVDTPRVRMWNDALALALGEDTKPNERAARYSGSGGLPDVPSLATAYAGHQFGHFSPTLGDGRAHLLGDVRDARGRVREVQLKGSGRTPFSRGGDGRCALGPALREYIMSEALHALRIPTSRCLAVVETGEDVIRRARHPGAVVTRVASSHLRVGTFEYFAARGDLDTLRALVAFAITRHCPSANDAPDPTLSFFDWVLDAHMEMVVGWMRIGFIHGVMNTDNAPISGETLDFGPCAMLGAYNPETAYSAIDTQRRYAFGRQPALAVWNLAQLANTLVRLIDAPEAEAVTALQSRLDGLSDRFAGRWRQMMHAKLGLLNATPEDEKRLDGLLQHMRDHQLDYTNTFDELTRAASGGSAPDDTFPTDWMRGWRNREPDAELMRSQNPMVIPRNHQMEAVLSASEDSGSDSEANAFLEVLRRPYEETDGTERYRAPPGDADRDYQTFCGT